jgi:dynein heavy chain
MGGGVIGLQLKPKPSLTLETILSMDAGAHADALQAVADTAAKEFSLEKALLKMQGDWARLIFDVLKYKRVSPRRLSLAPA